MDLLPIANRRQSKPCTQSQIIGICPCHAPAVCPPCAPFTPRDAETISHASRHIRAHLDLVSAQLEEGSFGEERPFDTLCSLEQQRSLMFPRTTKMAKSTLKLLEIC